MYWTYHPHKAHSKGLIFSYDFADRKESKFA